MTSSGCASARTGSAAAVPAYEAIVLDRTGSPLAFRTIVNARTGAILARTNLTDNFATTRIKHANAAQTFPFNGEVAADGRGL